MTVMILELKAIPGEMACTGLFRMEEVIQMHS